MIACLLVKFVLTLFNGFTVTEITCFEAKHLGHDFYHNDGVLLRPESKRHKNNFSRKGKKKNCRPPTTGKIVCRLNNK